MSDYPTLMYKCPGAHFASDGLTYDYIPVSSREDLLARLSEGWSVTLGEAMAAVTVAAREAEAVETAEEQAEKAAQSREDLEAKATELGIKFDGRTTDAALLRKIEAAGGE